MTISSSITKTNESNRIFGLDIFRAFAILLVVSTHGSFLLGNTSFSEFPYIKMIDGVDLFFVLSGFLIGGILLQQLNSKPTFEISDLAVFWKRRWFRTLPNYYLILLVNYIIIHTGIIKEDIHQFSWKYLFFFQNFLSPAYGFFWESWSLSVEEWFYILSPLLLLIASKFLSPKKSFLLVTCLMLLIPFIHRVHSQNATIDDFWFDVTFRKVVVMRLDSIAYGLLAAWFYCYYNHLWTKLRFVCLIIGISIIAFIVHYDDANTSFYKQVIYFTITPISAMLLLPFAQSIKKAKGMVAKGITHISKISYSMYLVNLAVIAEVIRDNFAPTTAMDGILKYILFWILVVAVSTFLYTYFEKPIMNLRDRKPRI